MAYEIEDKYDRHSNVKAEQRNSQLAPSVNILIEVQYKEIQYYANNIVSVEMAFRTSFYPSEFIDVYRMLSDTFYAIKDNDGLLQENLLSDEALEILADIYEDSFIKCVDNFAIGYQKVLNRVSEFSLEKPKRKDSLSSITPALTGYITLKARGNEE